MVSPELEPDMANDDGDKSLLDTLTSECQVLACFLHENPWKTLTEAPYEAFESIYKKAED